MDKFDLFVDYEICVLVMVKNGQVIECCFCLDEIVVILEGFIQVVCQVVDVYGLIVIDKE